MHPSFLLLLAAERAARFRRDADARRLVDEVTRQRRPGRAPAQRAADGPTTRLTRD